MFYVFVTHPKDQKRDGDVVWVMFEGDPRDRIYTQSYLIESSWQVYNMFREFSTKCILIEESPAVRNLPVIVKEYIHFNVGRLYGNEVFNRQLQRYVVSSW